MLLMDRLFGFHLASGKNGTIACFGLMNLNPEQHEGFRMNSTTSTTLGDYFAVFERSRTYKGAVLE